MVVEIKLAGNPINLNQLFPMESLVTGLVVLDEFELVGETSPNDKLVLSAFVVGPNLLGYEPLVVLVNCDSLNKAIDLFAFREHVNATLLVKNSLLTFGTAVGEFVLIYDEFGRPWWRHIKRLSIFLDFFT